MLSCLKPLLEYNYVSSHKTVSNLLILITTYVVKPISPLLNTLKSIPEPCRYELTEYVKYQSRPIMQHLKYAVLLLTCIFCSI